jgi:hypothetical protein
MSYNSEHCLAGPIVSDRLLIYLLYCNLNRTNHPNYAESKLSARHFGDQDLDEREKNGAGDWLSISYYTAIKLA